MSGPGKQSLVQASYGSQAPQEKQSVEQVGTPGKRTLVEGLATGKPQSVALEKTVKDRLLRDIHGRTNRAYTAYMKAITDLEVAEMIEKDEEIGIFTEILVGAVFGVVGAGLMGALKELKSVEKIRSSLKEIGSRVASESVKSGIEEISERSLEITVGSVLDVGKDHVKGGIKKAGGEGGERPGDVQAGKTSALRYLRSLEISGSKLFQEMDEVVPDQLNDSELLAYWAALDSDYQNAPAYHDMIEENLRKYMSSDTHNIGRTRVDSDRGGQGYDPIKAIRETRVAWLVAKDGSKQLVYVHRGFDEIEVMNARNSTFANKSRVNGAWDGADGGGALSYADEYVKDNKSTEVKSLTEDDVFAGFVEPDMVDTALRLHHATWRYSPRTYSYDFLARAMAPDAYHQD